MVRLTRIYTRTGDQGMTRLADNSVVAKTDVRVAAYGDVDEANSVIGMVLAGGDLPGDVAAVLRQVQNDLFDLGADLSTPLTEEAEHPALRIAQEYVDRLEGWCDRYGDPLPALTSFVLPGGLPAAAHLHLARTVVRRAERLAWGAMEQYGTTPAAHSDRDRSPGGLNVLAVTYLNRLSDLLFILTRVLNGTEHEPLWVPGGQRVPNPRDQAAARSQPDPQKGSS
jgi:cob(I)alamin adenosyltransferase